MNWQLNTPGLLTRQAPCTFFACVATVAGTEYHYLQIDEFGDLLDEYNDYFPDWGPEDFLYVSIVN